VYIFVLIFCFVCDRIDISNTWGEKMKLYDISQELLSAKIYEDDPAPKVENLMSMEDGEMYNLSALSMCAHNGTHIDAPKHFIKNGKAVDEIPLETLVGRCFVAEHNGDVSASAAEKILEKAREAGASERILLKGTLTVTEDAARVFAHGGIKLLGNEGQTVGPADAPMAVHLILLSAEVVLLEGIVLKNVSDGAYLLSAAPINIRGIEGSPCRTWLAEV
jgi:arylformamidase